MLLAAVVALAASGACAEGLPSDCAFEAGPRRTVSSVPDGETLVLDDGVVVRLAAVLAPKRQDIRADDATPWPTEGAARAALSRLALGRTVALSFAGPRSDRYERAIAHAVVEGAEGETWLQAALVETGHARVFANPGGEACIEHLLRREAVARAARLGLWAQAAYQVRAADHPAELARYRNTFQIVEGRIEKVIGSRALLIAELANAQAGSGTNAWRASRAFRMTWARSDQGLLGDMSPPSTAASSSPAAPPRGRGAQRADDRALPRDLEGRAVRVRGWVTTRFGPQIEVLARGQIEMIEALGSEAHDGQPGPHNAKRPADGPPGAEADRSQPR